MDSGGRTVILDHNVVEVKAAIPDVLSAVTDGFSSWSGGAIAFFVAIGMIFLSMQLFDRTLDAIDKQRLRNRYVTKLNNKWTSFGIGLVFTGLTTSVAFSLGVIVPLYNRGHVKRNEIIPYVLGANIGTLVDTLIVAIALNTPVGVMTVALLLGISFVVSNPDGVLQKIYEGDQLGSVGTAQRYRVFRRISHHPSDRPSTAHCSLRYPVSSPMHQFYSTRTSENASETTVYLLEDTNMIAITRLEIIPVRERHMSDQIADAIETLVGFDVTYELTPMDTVIEADDVSEIFDAAAAAHEAIDENRVITSWKSISNQIGTSTRRIEWRQSNTSLDGLQATNDGAPDRRIDALSR
ncbi:thiamine-binding protein [Natrinema halophilum]|uniref:thiamine-binding protein n=1 Tax=Natrinema halophilum TaxID=1699371 RepID=UPI001F48F77F|nr:thiamine-binding protein [Natrinema halophilum]UHQ96097.1 thiamine-binding protein [Natrinema halophilum]